MTSTLLVLLLLSQAERPDDPPAGAMEPPLPASIAGGWHYLTRLEATGLTLLPRAGAGAEEAFAQVEPTLVLEVRWRFGCWLYAVGQGGTLLFPAPDGTLHPGAFASLGLGVDHVR
jgi:hypothetical protein